MRRLLAALALYVSLLCPVALPLPPQATAQASQDPKSQTVYITRTRQKYHREGCRYLAQSKSPVSFKDAKTKGCAACKMCRPSE
jgi:hypothetical protein